MGCWRAPSSRSSRVPSSVFFGEVPARPVGELLHRVGSPGRAVHGHVRFNRAHSRPSATRRAPQCSTNTTQSCAWPWGHGGLEVKHTGDGIMASFTRSHRPSSRPSRRIGLWPSATEGRRCRSTCGSASARASRHEGGGPVRGCCPARCPAVRLERSRADHRFRRGSRAVHRQAIAVRRRPVDHPQGIPRADALLRRALDAEPAELDQQPVAMARANVHPSGVTHPARHGGSCTHV